MLKPIIVRAWVESDADTGECWIFADTIDEDGRPDRIVLDWPIESAWFLQWGIRQGVRVAEIAEKLLSG